MSPRSVKETNEYNAPNQANTPGGSPVWSGPQKLGFEANKPQTLELSKGTHFKTLTPILLFFTKRASCQANQLKQFESQATYQVEIGSFHLIRFDLI